VVGIKGTRDLIFCTDHVFELTGVWQEGEPWRAGEPGASWLSGSVPVASSSSNNSSGGSGSGGNGQGANANEPEREVSIRLSHPWSRPTGRKRDRFDTQNKR